MPTPRSLRRAAATLTLTAAAAATVVTVLPTTTVHAAGSADGAVTQTLVTTNPAVGTTALLVVTVTNNGPDAITEAIVPGSAPTGASLNTVTPSQGACAKGRNSVYTCNFGLLPAGASARATVSATLQQAGPVTAQASLQTLGSSDPDLTNNVARTSFVVAGGTADLQLGGSMSTKAPDPGAQFDYRVGVKVAGKTTAENVVLTIDLPAGATFVGIGSIALDPACTAAGTTWTCSLGSLAGGTSLTVVATVFAPGTVGTDLTATARIAHAAADPKLDNNSVTLTATTR